MSRRKEILTNIKQSYTLPLKLLIEMLTETINQLKKTNTKLDTRFNAIQQSYMTLNREEALGIILESNCSVDYKSVYGLHGMHPFTVKQSITKRNEMIAHFNIMLMKLNTRVKMTPNMEIKFVTEEELFLNFSKIFHAKLFESNLFKKICNEIWESYIASTHKKENNNITQLFKERLDLYCQGVLEVSKQSCDYYLHKAIIDNKFSLMQQLCAGQR